MSSNVYVVLVHFPVLDRAGDTMTTSITNMDVHDIARSCRTYGVEKYFIVTPIELQRALVQTIVKHWVEGSGGKRIPERTEALARCAPSHSIGDVFSEIERLHGVKPKVVTTSAKTYSEIPSLSFPETRRWISEETHPVVLLFGTGHGLATSVLEQSDYLLEPIAGVEQYNHLSVRAAVAIVLDRLFGSS